VQVLPIFLLDIVSSALMQCLSAHQLLECCTIQTEFRNRTVCEVDGLTKRT
jgi:hypothetical protein